MEMKFIFAYLMIHLLALESYFGLVETWYNFALKHKNLKIELRTKAANTKLFETLTLSNKISL